MISESAIGAMVDDVAKEVAPEKDHDTTMFCRMALCAVQLGVETAVEKLFAKCRLLGAHAKRSTVCLSDLEAALVLRAGRGCSRYGRLAGAPKAAGPRQTGQCINEQQ